MAIEQIAFANFTGLSMDAKPTVEIDIASTFYETDTKLTWFFNGTNWVIRDGFIPPLSHTTNSPPPLYRWNDKNVGQEDYIKWRDNVGMDWLLGKKIDPSTLIWNSGLIMDGLFTITVSGTGLLFWGDNTFDRYDGTNVILTHTYSLFDGTIYFKGTLTKIYNITVGSDLHHDIGNLPSGLTMYYNTGNNTTSGDIGNLPDSLTYYRNQGSNTTSGDIGNLPRLLVTYRNDGNTTASGDIKELPINLTFYYSIGHNTTSGDIASLPSGLTMYYNTGYNTTSGDIGSLPLKLYNYTNTGYNTTSGDIARLPPKLTIYNNQGTNTTFGDIGNLPITMSFYRNDGNNTTSGDIGNLSKTRVYHYRNKGSNTTLGNIGSMPNTIRAIDVSGKNQISEYVKGTHLWNIDYYQFHLEPIAGFGLDSTEVDNIIIDLSKITWKTSINYTKELWVAGNNAARTAASDAAVVSLTAQGVRVTTN